LSAWQEPVLLTSVAVQVAQPGQASSQLPAPVWESISQVWQERQLVPATHWPLLQTAQPEQANPQAPQLSLSVWRSTQTSSQQVSAVVQVVTQ
jgi:hypothetical protein